MHTVDTWFYTHDLIKEDDYNDHSCTLKIMIALHASIYSGITCINSFIAYHKKWSWDSNGHNGMFGFQIGLSDRKISHN